MRRSKEVVVWQSRRERQPTEKGMEITKDSSRKKDENDIKKNMSKSWNDGKYLTGVCNKGLLENSQYFHHSDGSRDKRMCCIREQ